MPDAKAGTVEAGGIVAPVRAIAIDAPAAGAAGGQLPFVGRERELATLEGSLSRAIAGEGGTVLIAGEPGIGKTRLVEELVSLSEADGRFAQPPVVAAGHCWDGGGAPALWPWSTVLRELVADAPAEELRRDLGVGAPWIAALVPELHALLPDLGHTPPLDSDRSRFVLFDAITTFLRHRSARRPVLVVLDDIHAADQPTLLALLFLARQVATMRVLVTGTHREVDARRDERLASLLTKLERECLRIKLPGLDREDISRLIEHRTGACVASELVATLYLTTGGNPFFAGEALRMLQIQGGIQRLDPSALLSLSSGVQAVVEQRLAALEGPVLTTLRCAAAAGSAFSLGLLTQASGRSRGEVAEDLGRAVDENLVQPREDEVGIFEFSHGLIREAILARMTSSQRAAAHEAIATALERRYAGSIDVHLEELAHHYLKSLAVCDPAPALSYAERAARRAMSLFAYERAARLYAAALEVLDLVEHLADDERVRKRGELLLGLGRAYQRVADPRARETLGEAADAARAGRDGELLAAVALTVGAFGFSPGTVDTELAGLLREALETTPPPDDRLRALLLGRLARALYWDHDSTSRTALAGEAIAVARTSHDPAALATALGNGLLATRSADTSDSALQLIDELLSIPEAPPEMIVAARSHEIDLLLERGQVNAADASLESLERQVERLRDLRAAAFVPLHRARRAAMEGRFTEAQGLLQQAAVAAEHIEDSTFPLTIGGGHIALDLLRGQPELVQHRVAPLVHGLPNMHLWRACLVASHVAQGESERARRELERTLASGVQAIPRDTMWLITIALLSEGAAAVGDAGLARALYDALIPFSGRNVVSPVSGYRGPVDRYLGLLAERLGAADAAEAHLRSAVATARHQHAKPMQALAAIDLARVLIAGADHGPGGEAAELLDIAARLGQEIGRPDLAGVTAAHRDRLDLRPGPVRAGVSAAECSDAALVCEGNVWAFTFEDRTFRLRDSKGLRQLATLLSRPGQPIHALDLARQVSVEPARAGAGVAVAAGELSVEDVGAHSGPLLDEAAKSAYRRRLRELEEEVEEAERWSDLERASRARIELDFITAELAAAVGLGGRDRPGATAAERARVNVTRSLRTAIRRVGEVDQRLRTELELTVRTGLFCVYEPDPRRPVAWLVRPAPIERAVPAEETSA